MSHYVSYVTIPLSMGSNQKNIQNFVWFVKLLATSPTDFDGIGCFDTFCMMCFCLNQSSDTEMMKVSSSIILCFEAQTRPLCNQHLETAFKDLSKYKILGLCDNFMFS